MNKYSSAHAAADKRHQIERARRGTSGARLRETRTGAWVVHDENNRRGGCFFTHEAALKYIRTEFGPDAQIITIRVPRKKAA